MMMAPRIFGHACRYPRTHDAGTPSSGYPTTNQPTMADARGGHGSDGARNLGYIYIRWMDQMCGVLWALLEGCKFGPSQFGSWYVTRYYSWARGFFLLAGKTGSGCLPMRGSSVGFAGLLSELQVSSYILFSTRQIYTISLVPGKEYRGHNHIKQPRIRIQM